MEYLTVEAEKSTEFFEKRSRFICHVKPVTTNQQAVDFINEKKQKYHDATHNVYAYILRDQNIMRYSDDGEPQGTAGLPALDVLRKESLTDLALVITRYFGGIMLGGGGLVRAYSKGAKEAITAGKIIKMCKCRVFGADVPYALFQKMTELIKKFCGGVLDSVYKESVFLKFYIRLDACDEFIKAAADETNANVSPYAIEDIFAKIS